MENNIVFNKEIKIKDVNKLWKDIKNKNKPVAVNLNNVETVDGAGLQLIIFLISISKEFPEQYEIHGLSSKLEQMLNSFGVNIEKGEKEI